MKRTVCIFLLLSVLLSGCQFLGDRIKEPVTFYYVRSNYREDLSSVIASEEREASGHRQELSYLMALYLMGPVSEQLRSPLPPGTRIFVEQNTGETVLLTLSDTEKTMTEAEFTMASACLAYTCRNITGAESVTIESGNRSVTITKTNLTLADAGADAATEEAK